MVLKILKDPFVVECSHRTVWSGYRAARDARGPGSNIRRNSSSLMMGTPNVFASFSFKVFSPCLLVKGAYVTVLSILSDFIKNKMRMSHISVEPPAA